MNITIWFDGACEPRNPGGVASCGWLIEIDGQEITSGCKVVAQGPTATNNLAEWSALGLALRWLLDNQDEIPQLPEEIAVDKGLRVASLTIHGDSQLVINQLNRSWACNKEHLRRLRDRCLELLEQIDLDWHAEWIPREQNERADALSRKAYEQRTGKRFPERVRR